jgi:hypothetical protein
MGLLMTHSTNEVNEGYIDVELGLGVKIRALDSEGNYVEWSIVVEPEGAIKVIADTARVDSKRRSPIIAVYPASNNSVVLKNGRP